MFVVSLLPWGWSYDYKQEQSNRAHMICDADSINNGVIIHHTRMMIDIGSIICVLTHTGSNTRYFHSNYKNSTLENNKLNNEQIPSLDYVP